MANEDQIQRTIDKDQSWIADEGQQEIEHCQEIIKQVWQDNIHVKKDHGSTIDMLSAPILFPEPLPNLADHCHSSLLETFTPA